MYRLAAQSKSWRPAMLSRGGNVPAGVSPRTSSMPVFGSLRNGRAAEARPIKESKRVCGCMLLG